MDGRGGIDRHEGKTVRSIAHAALTLRTIGRAFCRVDSSAEPGSVIIAKCHPVTSGISGRL